MEVKTLQLADLEQQFNSTRKLHDGFLLSGERVRYYAKFSQSKIDKLLNELFTAVNISEEQELDFFREDKYFLQYAQYLTIKYFTDFGKQLPKEKDFFGNIKTFYQLIELDLFNDIIEQILPEEEVHRVLNKVIERSQLTIRLTEEMEKVQGLEEQATKRQQDMSNFIKSKRK